jgi:phenylalanine-4-hydroxylase
MEYALGHMRMTASEFWNLSPVEFAAARKGFATRKKLDLRDQITASWYSGAMSQADLKKNALDKFLDGIDQWLMPDEALKKKEDNFKRLESIWDSVIR